MANIVMLNAIASADFECQTDKLILYFLATKCFNSDTFSPSASYSMVDLAEACCIKDRTAVFKSIKRLESSGWVRSISPGKKMPNIYVLCLPKKADESYPQHVAQKQHVDQEQHIRCSETTSHVAQKQHHMLLKSNTSYNYNNNSYKEKIFEKIEEKQDEKKPEAQNEPVQMSRLMQKFLIEKTKG